MFTYSYVALFVEMLSNSCLLFLYETRTFEPEYLPLKNISFGDLYIILFSSSFSFFLPIIACSSLIGLVVAGEGLIDR